MEAADRGVVALWFELDSPNPSEVCANVFYVSFDAWTNLCIAREDRVLVCVFIVAVPKTATVECAIGSRDRREIGVAATFPIHIFEREEFVVGDRRIEIS